MSLLWGIADEHHCLGRAAQGIQLGSFVIIEPNCLVRRAHVQSSLHKAGRPMLLDQYG